MKRGISSIREVKREAIMELTKNKFKEDYLNILRLKQVKNLDEATLLDQYVALATLIREYIAQNWIRTNENYLREEKKKMYYFSMEFLIGKLLMSNLINLGIKEVCEAGLKEMGLDLTELEGLEQDPGIGNGGLGRLAACFLDSMASLDLSGHGYGIRYQYGLFEQKIINGYQKEYPDKWLENENMWEIKRVEETIIVKFSGKVRMIEENKRLKFIHENYESVLAIPYDIPILGYENNRVNTLRLWKAKCIEDGFDYRSFSNGEYTKAFENKHYVEAISQVLYPDDSYLKGKILRLKQEYFFVSAGIQNIINTFKKRKKPIQVFHEYVAIHINDTHPTLAIPELMRILLDEENLEWDEAWNITQRTISYTNHTIMAEALEKWNIDLFQPLLPRIFMIIEEINKRFCNELEKNKETVQSDKIKEMAIISDGVIKMAYLAIVGSHSVNGVASLHTEILKKKELNNFNKIYPKKFNNKTNGINHRRWLLQCNPLLSNWITEIIGTGWIMEPVQLRKLLDFKKDPFVQEKIYEIKQYNKNKLAKMIKEKQDIKIDPTSIFDIQAKRIHEYKRQLLNVLHIIHLYNELIQNPDLDIYPRTFIFSGKAAPGYYIAKQIIKLIHVLADKINQDRSIKNKLKVVFMENYGVSLAETIIPGANISEQISTTTKEASGTGNMKFMMNGAITLATLDGANVEIAKAVGKENIVLFGLKADEFYEINNNKSYKAMDLYCQDKRIKKIMDQLINGFFNVENQEFLSIYDSLLKGNDSYFVLKDFDSYINAHKKIDRLYRNKKYWSEMAIVNIGQSGIFSSDQTIGEYAKEIWNVH